MHVLHTYVRMGWMHGADANATGGNDRAAVSARTLVVGLYGSFY